MPGQLRFEVVSDEATDAEDVGLDLGLGGWQAVEPPPQPVSFDTGGASLAPAEEAPMIFRVSVKAADGESDAALSAELARLDAIHGSLDGVDARVDHALRAAEREAGVSFGTEAENVPELQLADWVRHARGEGGVSFSTEPEDEDAARIPGFLDRLWRRLGNFVVIQTQVAEELMASTRVTWGGDFIIVTHPEVRTEQWRLHERTVDAGLQQHRALLRIVLLTLRQASKIAIAAGTGNWLVALPAAFKFVKTLMTETKKLNLAA